MGKGCSMCLNMTPERSFRVLSSNSRALNLGLGIFAPKAANPLHDPPAARPFFNPTHRTICIPEND
jgi:hypothetical protein